VSVLLQPTGTGSRRTGRIFDFELTGEELSRLEALDPHRRHRERSGTQMVVRRPDPGTARSRDPDRSKLADPLAGLPLDGGRQAGL